MNTIAQENKTESVLQSLLGLLGWIGVCFLPSLTAIFVSVDGWYSTIQKPTWNPPSWLFGPVWTTLYLLMGISAWLVWRTGGWERNSVALSLFCIQLVLNAAWTPLFFGAHQLGWAFTELCVLCGLVAATIFHFISIHKVAAALLIPYLCWISFAAFLNFTVWQMN